MHHRVLRLIISNPVTPAHDKKSRMRASRYTFTLKAHIDLTQCSGNDARHQYLVATFDNTRQSTMIVFTDVEPYLV